MHLDALVSVNESRLGVPGASVPGRIFEAQFLADAIAQSFPLASGSNMITVTLRTNVDLAHGSNVTIAGWRTPPFPLPLRIPLPYCCQ